MELSEDQRNRIKENRQRALLIVAQKKEQKEFASQIYDVPSSFSTAPGNEGNASNHVCTGLPESTSGVCTNTNIDTDIYEHFGELICSSCKSSTTLYECLTKNEAVKQYLVTSDAMTTLKFKTRNNPHNANWTPMKLYLRKHVLQLALKRHGTLEKLEEIKAKKETEAYSKSLEKTSDILGSSTEELWNNLTGTDVTVSKEPGIVCAPTGATSDNKRGRPPSTATSQKNQKKKFALNSLIKIVQS
jgi:hypothetical protein